MAKTLFSMFGADELAKFGERKVTILNQRKCTPIVVLVDTSFAMQKYDNLLKGIVSNLYESLISDGMTRNSVDLSILAFNTEIQILRNTIGLKELAMLDLHFDYKDTVLIGLSLMEAIKMLEQRKQFYRSCTPAIKFYKTILFLILVSNSYISNQIVQNKEHQAIEHCMKYFK